MLQTILSMQAREKVTAKNSTYRSKRAWSQQQPQDYQGTKERRYPMSLYVNQTGRLICTELVHTLFVVRECGGKTSKTATHFSIPSMIQVRMYTAQP